jgi:hypothetical protein
MDALDTPLGHPTKPVLPCLTTFHRLESSSSPPLLLVSQCAQQTCNLTLPAASTMDLQRHLPSILPSPQWIFWTENLCIYASAAYNFHNQRGAY